MIEQRSKMKSELEQPLENTSKLNPSPLTGETKTSLADLVASHPFLKGLPARHLETLTDSAMLKEFQPGERIFREGDMANRFYLLRQGKVALEKPDPEAEPVLIQYVGAGEALGWSWLFAPYYWHFDARVVEPTKAIFFYGTRLREQCEEDNSLGYELMKRMVEVLIERLHSTQAQLLDWHHKRR